MSGWEEHRMHVVRELERLAAAAEAQEEMMGAIRLDLSLLRTEVKFRSGVWGAITGLIPAIGVLIYLLLSGSLR